MTLKHVIFVLCFVVGNYSTNFSETTGFSRLKRQTSSCTPFQFACKSGECLSEDVGCDGTEDCKDGSDEDNCSGLTCPSFSFQCAYGACINSKFECDGKKDCRDNSDENSPKCKKQKENPNECRSEEYQCKSGECIDESLVCDGRADCQDASDETSEICSRLNCPMLSFRCKYGACVSMRSKCDGIRQCQDGSDEDPNLCGLPTTRPPPTVRPSSNKCVLPDQIQNGLYTIYGMADSSRFKKGDQVDAGTILFATCDAGHQLVPNNSLIICNKGTPAMPQCVRTCELGDLETSTDIECEFNRGRVDCNRPFSGVKATFNCKYFYEDPTLEFDRVRYCNNGRWDKPLPYCRPACGRKIGKVKPLVVGGKVVQKGHYPWQAGIHRRDQESRKMKHICGGSIISLRLVISAAHCFTEVQNGRIRPKDDYGIAVGKYYRDWEDTRDTSAQTFKIKSMHIPERYAGINSRFEYDIVVIKLDGIIILSDVVQPVCVDWNNNYETETFTEGNTGVVLGWGFTVYGGSPSDELRELSVPYVPYKECVKKLDVDIVPFFTADKICAGFIGKGVSVCEGDSGGGLSFRLNRDNRYYLRGLVSVSPRGKDETASCDVDQYALYTNIGYHLAFIRQYEFDNTD